jgi:Ca2+-binding RTX toxin-like protein
VFNTAPGAGNVDAITDFNVVADTIRVENSVFAALGAAGTLTADKFHIGAAAHDASDRIIYNAANGRLYFDADGAGGAAQIQIATLAPGLLLSNADFLVI